MHGATTPGELNFEFSVLIEDYLKANWPVNYQVLNDVLGALSGAAAEFNRRVVVPYEETKLAENGDVYSEGHTQFYSGAEITGPPAGSWPDKYRQKEGTSNE